MLSRPTCCSCCLVPAGTGWCWHGRPSEVPGPVSDRVRLGSWVRPGPGYSTVRALLQKPLGRGRVPEFLLVFLVVGRFPWVSGRVSYSPGPISGSVLLWLCFCRQKPPCTRILGVPGAGLHFFVLCAGPSPQKHRPNENHTKTKRKP